VLFVSIAPIRRQVESRDTLLQIILIAKPEAAS
jgi:hypothetical protein